MASHRDLAFLLSLGHLPVACFTDNGLVTTGPATTPSDTSTTTDTGTTTDATTSDQPTSTATTTTTDATDATDATDTTETRTTGEPVDSTGPDDDTTGEPLSYTRVCTSYFEHKYVTCGGKTPEEFEYYLGYVLDECLALFNTGLATDGPPCVEAIREYYVCISMLPCSSEEGMEACLDSGAAMLAACPSLG